MNRFFKSLNSVLCILCISIFTSQCFAQSAAASANADALKSRQYLELINSVFEYVRSNYVDEVDPQVLYEGAMKGIMNALGDPYSSYLDTKQMSSLNDTTGGNFGGVGLSISKAAESTPENPAYVLVASPIEDTPGFKAGIQAGDLIISIDGTDTSTLTMDEVLGHLRGVIGESVSLIVRRGKNMEFPVTLVRALIEVPTVKYGMIDKTGYIKIIEFTPQTPERVQEALDNFEQEKYTSLIIDLRNNPGGSLTDVVSIADDILGEGVIVSVRGQMDAEGDVYRSNAKGIKVPLAIIVNENSASASEILAAAVQDFDAGIVVGMTTYGKGVVQTTRQLEGNRGWLKLTTDAYYTPNGANIDGVGVIPDIEIDLPEELKALPIGEVEQSDDVQLWAALDYVRALADEMN